MQMAAPAARSHAIFLKGTRSSPRRLDAGRQGVTARRCGSFVGTSPDFPADNPHRLR